MESPIDNNQLRLTYNPDGSPLRNIQLRMLDILQCVDEICQRHHIRYWLSSGSLLGAVRHKGFIPWDDDLDIEMLREDYLHLMQVLPTELPAQYVVQTNQTDNAYIYLYGKVRDLHSRIREKSLINQTFQYQGIFIDLFVVEPSFKSLAKFAAILYNRLCFNPAQKGGFMHTIAMCNRRLLKHYIFPIFRLISKCAPQQTLRHTFGVNFLKARHTNDIFPLQRISFEGIMCNAPANPDAYLQKIYGNYMQIPDHKDIHIINNDIELW